VSEVDEVEDFIIRRGKMRLNSRLHVIWYVLEQVVSLDSHLTPFKDLLGIG